MKPHFALLILVSRFKLQYLIGFFFNADSQPIWPNIERAAQWAAITQDLHHSIENHHIYEKLSFHMVPWLSRTIEIGWENGFGVHIVLVHFGPFPRCDPENQWFHIVSDRFIRFNMLISLFPFEHFHFPSTLELKWNP